MIKWIGQHIVSLIARFRDDVYLENLTESTQDHVVGIDDDGKLYKQDRGTTDSFTVEDGDTTDVVISNGKHWKFVEGGGININWTDTSTGSSTDEYDLTFSLSKSLSELLADDGHVIRGIAPHNVLIQSAQNLKFQIDYDESSIAGTHTFDFINGAGSTVATIDESGVPTFSIGGKGSAASSVIVDGGSGSLTSRTLSEFKSDASLSNVENKSSATIRGEIVDSDIPALNASKVTGGTFDDARIPDLGASKVTSGTFADARIPDLAASKVTSGTFDAARIPTLNQDTTGNATTATTAGALAAGNQTIEGNITAQTSSIPLLALKRTGTLSDSDGVGTIRFTGNNDADELIRYATIAGAINDVSDGAEEGKLTLSVASHDGETQPGVTIVSGNAEDEVDVTIGNEATSVTTITGTLTMGSTAFVNNSGVIQVATQGTIDHDSLANYVANEHIDWTSSSTGTIHSTNIPTLNQDTTGTAANATKQLVVTTHNFQLNNNTTIKNYVPFNNLNESTSGGPMNNYWTRTLAPYPGTIKKIAVRSQTSLGSSCTLRISKITDTTDKLEDGTHVDNTSIDLSTAQTTVITTMNTNSFAAGDAVGVALQRSAGTAAQVIVTIVWEYTT